MNPALKKLGFDKRDRVVLVHADDVGVSQASIDAYLELVDFGIVSTGSAMPPCPLFPEVARHAREDPALDLGLHLPVTCEYETHRWRPLSHPDPDAGLVDEEGCFHHDPLRTISGATVESVRAEVEAQVQLSLSLGLQPTHLDSHHAVMLLNRGFLEAYVELALEHGLLPMLPRIKPFELLRSFGGLGSGRSRRPGRPRVRVDLKALVGSVRALAKKARELEERGFPVIDHLIGMPLRTVADRLSAAKRRMSELKPGLTHFVLHPAKDTPEERAMSTRWPYRAGDYETFMSDELRDHIRNEGLQIIGYRALAELVPD